MSDQPAYPDEEHGERGLVVGMLLVIFVVGALCGALADRLFCGGF